ncbi:MAG: TrmH family RNA methyltransferase [Thermoleophilaceae bacterium]
MITASDNSQLKLIRRLQRKRERDQLGLFAAEGEDLVAAAAASGWEPEVLLWSGQDVEPELLDRVSSLGSGSRVIGVYRQRLSNPGGRLSVYLHGVADPGNVGSVLRSAHALCDGPVVRGPGSADPFGPKAVRASMGSLFARPPAKASWGELQGTTVALDARAPDTLGDSAAVVEGPVVVLVGAEREGLPGEVAEGADVRARIPLRGEGPESLNAAMAATIALYELRNRMAADA